MTFRLLLEKTKLLGKLKKYEKVIYQNYIDLKDYFKVNIDVTVSFRKKTGKIYFGYVDLVGLSEKKYKIVLEEGYFNSLSQIGHEFTHIVQFIKKDLGYTSVLKNITWKGKEFISVKDYGKITQIDEHKKLPWEAEAYKLQDKLPELFKNSKHYEALKGVDATLDFIIDSDSVVI